MKKSLLIRCAIGFVMGLAFMVVVPALINGVPIGSVPGYSDRFQAIVGSPAAAKLLNLLVIGLFGMACMGCTVFYEIESWSLAKATLTHYLVIALGYLLVSRVLCWDMPPKLFLLIEGIMTVCFFLIWLIMYLLYKKQVRELNELMKKRGEPKE